MGTFLLVVALVVLVALIGYLTVGLIMFWLISSLYEDLYGKKKGHSK
jgi:membrane-anchored glycerophosphoryl diester phosphodiesterase (GDPDase)